MKENISLHEENLELMPGWRAGNRFPRPYPAM